MSLFLLFLLSSRINVLVHRLEVSDYGVMLLWNTDRQSFRFAICRGGKRRERRRWCCVTAGHMR